MSRLRRPRYAIAAAIIGVIALAITLASAVAFWPRLSLSSDANLDPTDPFATPFILHNDGYFQLSAIRAICSAISLNTAAPGNSSLYFGIGLTSDDLNRSALAPDGQFEFTCPVPQFPTPITATQLQIFVSFKARLIPQSYGKRCFSVTTRPDKGGYLRWFASDLAGHCAKPTVIWNFRPRQPNVVKHN